MALEEPVEEVRLLGPCGLRHAEEPWRLVDRSGRSPCGRELLGGTHRHKGHKGELQSATNGSMWLQMKQGWELQGCSPDTAGGRVLRPPDLRVRYLAWELAGLGSIAG